MKSIFALLFTVIGSINLNAQQYWSKTFEVHPGTEQVWQMNVVGDTILMAAISTCADFSPCTFIVSLNLDGDVSQIKNFVSKGGVFAPSGFPGLNKFEDNYSFSVLTDKFDSIVSRYLIFLEPTSMDLVDKIPLVPKVKVKRNTIGHQILDNGNILDYGQEVGEGSLTSLILIDRDKKILWQREYGGQFHFNGLTSPLAEMTPNKIAGISQSCTGCEYPTMKPYVFAVDTLGELVFDLYLDTMISDINRGQRPLIAPYDSTSFVMVWYQQKEYSGFENNPYIARIGQDGTIFWRLVLPLLDPSTDVRYIHQLIRAKNGDYILAGERIPGHVMPGKGLSAVGCALRISPEGEVIWDRVYHEPDVKYPQRQFFWNVAEDEDENLYFSGEVQDSVVNEISNDRNTNFWLVKVGPDGCIEPGCTEQVILLPTQQPFRILPEDYLRVYPNPVRDLLQVSWEDLPIGAAFLQVHDISGRILGIWPVSQASGTVSLDVRTWPGGVVFLSLRSDHWMTLPVKVVRE